MTRLCVDGGIWKWFEVTHDQSYAIDYEIGGYETIGIAAAAPDRCPSTTKPFAYLGKAVVVP